MELFTPEIEQQLQAQYHLGGDLDRQNVICKIFNPYGNGTWYLINQDPDDPDYLWCIADLFEVEVGSVLKSELVSFKIPPFGLSLERDLYFKPINAAEAYKKLINGEAL